MTKGLKASTRKFCPERTSALTSPLYTCSFERTLPFPSLKWPAFPDILPGMQEKCTIEATNEFLPPEVSSYQTTQCFTSSSGQTYPPCQACSHCEDDYLIPCISGTLAELGQFQYLSETHICYHNHIFPLFFILLKYFVVTITSDQCNRATHGVRGFLSVKQGCQVREAWRNKQS